MGKHPSYGGGGGVVTPPSPLLSSLLRILDTQALAPSKFLKLWGLGLNHEIDHVGSSHCHHHTMGWLKI